jgi:transcriptional regulator with XRE-family HTH domain
VASPRLGASPRELAILATSPAFQIAAFSFSLEGTVVETFSVSSMAPHRLENYLLSYRKESGLSQEEVGFLLGCEDGTLVSRYEKRRRLPPIKTLLACEEIFGAPIAELFAGMQQSVKKDVARRRLELMSKLQAKALKGSAAQTNAYKLRKLAERDASLGTSQTSSLA